MKRRLRFDGGRVEVLRRLLAVPLDGDRQVVPPRVLYAEPATVVERTRLGVRRRLAAKRVAQMHLRSA